MALEGLESLICQVKCATVHADPEWIPEILRQDQLNDKDIGLVN